MLNNRLVGIFVVLGMVFWASGMLTVRVFGSTVFTPENPLMAVFYLLAFPLLWVALFIARKVSQVPMNQMIEPTTIMTFTAIFIDGLVIGWFPHIYGDDSSQIMRGAAWILWGGGAGLFWAWILARRHPIR